MANFLSNFHLSRSVKYIKQSGIIISCLFAAKFIGLFAQARAALYLGTEYYGISGIFVGLSPFILLLVNLRMDVVLVRKFPKFEKNGHADELVDGVFLFRLILFCIVFVTGIILLGQNKDLAYCWILSGPFYLFQALRPYWLLQARKQLHFHYIGMLIQTLITACLIFLIFKPGQPLGSDLVVYGLGALGAFTVTWFGGRGRFPRLRPGLCALKDVVWLVFETRWVLLAGAVTLAYTATEMPLIVYLRSPEEAGAYRTSLMLADNLYTFLVFINSMMYPHLVEWKNQGVDTLFSKQKKLLLYFTPLSILLIGILYILAPWIYKFLYNGEYLSGVLPFQLLVVARVSTILTGIYSWGMMAKGEDKELLLILAPLSIAALCGMIITVPDFGINAAASISAAFSLAYLAAAFGLSLVRNRSIPR